MERLFDLLPCPDIIPPLDLPAPNSTTLLTDLHGGFPSPHLSNHTSRTTNQTSFETSFTNFTFPCLDMTDLPTQDTFKRVMTILNTYFTPVVIVIGATGNLLAFLVFTVTHLRRQSSSVYLASLALADMGFLLSLFIVWLGSVRIPVFTRNVWCQSVVYLTYVCTFLSVWYVVSFTVERYIIVWYPLRKDRFCTPRRARIVVLTLALAACVLYSFGTWTSGVVEVLGMPVCIPYPQYYHFFTAMEGVDTALKLIIPSTIVIVLNIRIIMKIISVDRQRQPFIRGGTNKGGGPVGDHKLNVQESASTGHIVHVRFRNQSAASSGHNNGTNHSPDPRHCSQSQSHSSDKNRMVAGLRTIADTSSEKMVKGRPEKPRSCIEFGHTEKIPVFSPLTAVSEPRKHVTCKSVSTTDIFRKCNARVHMRVHSQYRTARMLIVVSTVFVVLNLPSHVFRIHAFIKSSLTDDLSSRGHTDVRWHELFQLVYHLNFAINFFIYSVCGRQFRTGLKILYSRLVHRLAKCRRYIPYKTASVREV